MLLYHLCLYTDSIAEDDVSPSSGSIYFVSNEASRQITLSVMPDDLPEGQEVSQNIGRETSMSIELKISNIKTRYLDPSAINTTQFEPQTSHFHVRKSILR